MVWLLGHSRLHLASLDYLLLLVMGSFYPLGLLLAVVDVA